MRFNLLLAAKAPMDIAAVDLSPKVEQHLCKAEGEAG